MDEVKREKAAATLRIGSCYAGIKDYMFYMMHI